MSRPLPRYTDTTIEDERKLARILLETGEQAPPTIGHATAGGDERKLRGIPAIGRGVTGAIAGTSPHNARLDNIRQARYPTGTDWQR